MTATLRDDDLSLEPTTGSDEFIGFAIVIDGERVGTVALRPEDRNSGSIRWNAGPDNLPVAIRALRLAIDHAFDDLGWTRVEARIPVDRDSDIRAASISGLRREGIT